MKEQFTSGPWNQKLRKGTLVTRVLTAGDIIIGEIYESKANASLIAAAPEMYEALKAMYKEFYSFKNCMSGDKMIKAIDLAKAALSKANPQ